MADNFDTGDIDLTVVSACPACGHTVSRKYFTITHHRRLKYRICMQCGMIYQQHSMSEEGWNKYYASGYRKMYEGSNDPIENAIGKQKKRALFYADILESQNIRVTSHLDIGCSAGELLQRIADVYKPGIQVGLEPGKEYRELCRSNGFSVLSGIDEIIEQGLKFDLITCCHVLEHVTQPSVFLKTLKDLLSEEGTIFIEVPNGGNNIFAMEFAHPLVFNLESISSLLQSCGLAIVNCKIHGQPMYLDTACKNYLTLTIKKSKEVTPPFYHRINVSQIRRRVFRSTFWYDNDLVFLFKSPYRYLKLMLGKYEI